MRVIRNETPAYFDVDETLIYNHKGDIEMDYYGTKRLVKAHEEHISFLKSLKARGYFIIVHSHNGWAWAKQVVEKLNITEYVDVVMSKPAKIIDDAQPDHWLPPTIYIKERHEI